MRSSANKGVKKLNHQKLMEWILRIAVAGEFLGHAIFALQLKRAWVGWIRQLGGINTELASQILLFIGVVDLIIALTVLVKPYRGVLLWAAFWGFWTAFVRILVGGPVWDFVERWANWGAPLVLFYLRTLLLAGSSASSSTSSSAPAASSRTTE